MADPPDLDALARRYLELWQEQASAFAADPALAEIVTRLFGAFGAMSPAAGSSTGFGTSPADHDQSKSSSGGERRQPGTGADGARSNAASGAAAAGVASVADDDRLDELLRRIALIEERLAALEDPGHERGS